MVGVGVGYYVGGAGCFDNHIDTDRADLALLTVVAPDITDWGTE